ncbi:MAG: NfeD family protein [Dissulfurispiraceae bacterium]
MALFIIALTVCIFTTITGSAKNVDVKEGEIFVIAVNGVINPVAVEFIHRSLEKASNVRAEALVIELDTPGGLDTSMRSIVKDIMASSIPVIVYVAPSGARAASAGVFITLAAHVAAMAPGTNIGAAHPVSIGEKMDKVMSEKAANDAAAYIKSIALQRGRNAVWAEDAVRKSVSITENDALKNHVIDLVAKDTDSLLKAIDGRTVKVVGADKKFETANAKVVSEQMGLRLRILNLISDPSFAYILMLLGFYGLFFELTNPGSLLPGIVGTISLVLAFYAFQTLPVNYAGLLLIIIGISLFLLEVKVASYGLLTISGIISITMGSLMLFDSPVPFLRVSLSIIIPAAIITAFFFVVTFRLAYKAHKRKHATGSEALSGLEGIAKSDFGPQGGMVQVHGEFWSAYSDESIAKDDKIVVEAVSGLKLMVRKK